MTQIEIKRAEWERCLLMEEKRINGSQRDLVRILSLPCIQAYIRFNNIMENTIEGYETEGNGS